MERKQNRLAGDFRGAQLAAFALPTMIMMVFHGNSSGDRIQSRKP